MDILFSTSVAYENISEIELYFNATSSSVSTSLKVTSEEHDVDGVDISYRHRIIVAAIWCVVAAIGLFGNVLVVVSVIVARRLQTTTNILVVNLAIADFLTCLCLPLQSLMLLGQQAGKSPLPDIICAAVGGTIYTCVLCSISTLVAIAFVRWYVITKSVRGYRGLYTPRKMIIVVFIIWMESLLITFVPSFLGIVEFGHSHFYSLCSITDFNPRRVYYTLLQGLILLIALTAIGVFYALILTYVINNNRDLRARLPSSPDQPSHTESNNATSTTTSSSTTIMTTTMTTAATTISRGRISASCSRHLSARYVIHRREVAITKNLFTVVCVFALSYLPTAINLVVPGASVFTLYAIMIGLANNAVNPIIYGLKHPIFQDVFKSLLLCKFSGLSEA